MKTLDPERTSEGMQPPLPLAGLIAATITSFAMCRLPIPRFLSWSHLLASATGRVFAVFLAAILSNGGLYGTKAACENSGWYFALQMALCAIWLAPLALFICENSGWALLITAILVASIGASFRLLRNAPGDEIPSLVSAFETSSFKLLESPNWFKQFYAVHFASCDQFRCMGVCTRTFPTSNIGRIVSIPLTCTLCVGARNHVHRSRVDAAFGRGA